MTGDFQCGYIAILGRPNVGKSTLLNRILGQKISITSRKPQTTRVQTLGIKTLGNIQCIYIDTPGIQTKHTGAMNNYMNREASNAISHVDCILFLLEAEVWTNEDMKILELVRQSSAPVMLVINKIDKFPSLNDSLPFINKVSGYHSFNEIIPVSAKRNLNIDKLEEMIRVCIPVSKQQYPSDQLSDRNERFFAAEFIREQLIRHLGEELPYKLTVTIEDFITGNNKLRISAIIWVESSGQKKIIIGKEGAVLKKVGTLARKEMETMFGSSIFLQTWVKVKKNWTEDPGALKEFGFID